VKLLPAFTGVPEVNKVYQVDALTLCRALPDNYIDLTVTSPPYDNLRTYKGYTFDFQPIARELYRVTKPGGVVVWIVGDATINGSETLTSMRQALYFVDACGFKVHDTMIYQKYGNVFSSTNRYNQVFEFMFVLSKGVPNTTKLIKIKSTGHGGGKFSGRNADGSKQLRQRPNQGTKSLDNVWLIMAHGFNAASEIFTYNHPAIFPEELAERHILSWSNPGDLILDPFMGSGTTAKMARKNGRDYIGCDIALEYCDIARRRLAMPYTPNMFIERVTMKSAKRTLVYKRFCAYNGVINRILATVAGALFTPRHRITGYHSERKSL
jgi:site-specific DNA-methyltransferase (adenine-specific)